MLSVTSSEERGIIFLKTPNAILATSAWLEGLLFQYKALKGENIKQKRAG